MSSKLEKLRQIKERINIEVNGRDYCDNKKVNIFVANHNCLKDGFYLPMALDKDISSLISSRLIYKDIKERKKLVNECLYALPIEAHGGSVYLDICLQAGIKMIESGIDISIFPEGAYIEDDIIHRGRTGAIRILFNAVTDKVDVNLIPVAIDVDKENTDLDSYSFHDDKVVVSFLEPIEYMADYEKYMSTSNLETKNECLHSVMDTSFRNIAEALQKKYDNTYIELFPKNNVIFSNGVVLPTDLAQSSYYTERYKYEVDSKVKQYIKEIKG